MTTISATSATGSAATPATTTASTRGTLGQDSFLQLLTAQLQNQNPLDPLSNNEFVSQMAQFSTVNGINDINSKMSELVSGGGQSGISAVSSLIGKQVLVETPTTRADSSGTVAGRVTLDQSSSSVVVTYSDADTGALLYSQAMGDQPKGDMAFEWSDQTIAGHRVAVSVSAATAEGSADLTPSLYARVTGGAPGVTGQEATLDVEDFGQVSALEIQSIR